MYALTHKLRLESREEDIEGQSSGCRSATHQLQVEEERVIEPIKWMRSPHTSYRWRGEGESIQPNQVYELGHTPATGGDERRS